MRISNDNGRHYRLFQTSLGWAGVAATSRGIRAVVLPDKEKHAVERTLLSSLFGVGSSDGSELLVALVLEKAVHVLQHCFAGERISFDLPLDLTSGTPFQQAVWRAALQIPFGEVRSYAWAAKRIGNPRASRAVGRALGANPIPIIVPCHRVVRSAGGLGGYSGGLGLKRKLLDLEAHAHDR